MSLNEFLVEQDGFNREQHREDDDEILQQDKRMKIAVKLKALDPGTNNWSVLVALHFLSIK